MRPGAGGGPSSRLAAQVERTVVAVLADHPAGLARADLRGHLARALAAELSAPEVAALDTRLGHALSRLKAGGAVVHLAHRRAWRLRPAGGVRRDLPPPAVAGLPAVAAVPALPLAAPAVVGPGLPLLADAPQDPLF